MTKHLIAAFLATFTTTSAFAQNFADNPGPEHEALAKLAGEYTTVTRFRPTAGQAAQESKGSAKFTSVLDGRFILEESTGEQFGKQFKARKIYGYNNAAKRYESAWVYTASTAIMTLQGTSPDGGKTIRLNATVAQANDAQMNLIVTLKRINDDSFTVELGSTTPDGTAGPTLETTYTRKK
jgi:Protein of unknown function (DUF1579)